MKEILGESNFEKCVEVIFRCFITKRHFGKEDLETKSEKLFLGFRSNSEICEIIENFFVRSEKIVSCKIEIVHRKRWKAIKTERELSQWSRPVLLLPSFVAHFHLTIQRNTFSIVLVIDFSITAIMTLLNIRIRELSATYTLTFLIRILAVLCHCVVRALLFCRSDFFSLRWRVHAFKSSHFRVVVCIFSSVFFFLYDITAKAMAMSCAPCFAR